ncbi:MAG: PAS domain S-box protein, partial [Candidatus Hydrogenedentes bacterium]|nr:PAS domain S-box protein [Candidatus Hydrogenedentota bacterium]
AKALLAIGTIVFALSMWFNYGVARPGCGDFLEWIGTSFLMVGGCLIVRSLSRNRYITWCCYAGAAGLIFARLADYIDEFDGLAYVPLFGREGFDHTLFVRGAEGFGYTCLFLTLLAVLFELARMKSAAEREQKRYKDLHEASLFLARVADMSVEAVFGCDREGKIRSWNHGAGQLFGYTARDAIGMRIGELIIEGLNVPERDLVDRVRRLGAITGTEVVARTKEGRRLAAEASFSLVLDTANEPVGVSVIVRDIEKRKQAEQELIASRNILSGALQNADVGMFILDHEGRLVEFNARMEELTGLRRSEAPPLDEISDMLFGSSARFAKSVKDKVLTQGSQVEFRNLALRHRDGRKRVCNLAVSPVMGELGKIVAATGIAVDITDREALHAKLLESQKMESVGRLAGGVAHDFNNLLGGILGYASLLRQQLNTESTFRRQVEAIEDAATRASELTHQLLTFAKGGKYRVEPVNLNEAAQETVKLLSRSVNPNIHVRFEPSRTLSVVEADAAQMQQVLMNLCINARDAIEDEGEISIRIADMHVDENLRICLNLNRIGPYVRVTVSDTGSGMPPEVTQRMFEPFFSTKQHGRGYGLGLSVVYGIVEAHKGAIQVESEVGKGTSIHVYFPATGEPTPAPQKIARVFRGSTTGSETILVVDDEQLIRAVLHDILQFEGYTVFEAASGEEAIELYASNGHHIALIILDLLMPGMGGAKALTRLREINPDLRCIISSGFGTETVDRAQLVNPHTRFVSKPYQARALMASVRELLDA